MSIWQDEKAERNRQSLARLTKALHAFSLRLFYLGRSAAHSCRRPLGSRSMDIGGRIRFEPIA